MTGFVYYDRGMLQYKDYYNSEATYPNNPAETTEYFYDNLGRKIAISAVTPTYTRYYEYIYDEEGRIA